MRYLFLTLTAIVILNGCGAVFRHHSYTDISHSFLIGGDTVFLNNTKRSYEVKIQWYDGQPVEGLKPFILPSGYTASEYLVEGSYILRLRPLNAPGLVSMRFRVPATGQQRFYNGYSYEYCRKVVPFKR